MFQTTVRSESLKTEVEDVNNGSYQQQKEEASEADDGVLDKPNLELRILMQKIKDFGLARFGQDAEKTHEASEADDGVLDKPNLELRPIRRIQDFDESKDHCLTLKNTSYPHQRCAIRNTLVNEKEQAGFTQYVVSMKKIWCIRAYTSQETTKT
nr:hypothetical protein [Tanacetum cinerariifolium]